LNILYRIPLSAVSGSRDADHQCAGKKHPREKEIKEDTRNDHHGLDDARLRDKTALSIAALRHVIGILSVNFDVTAQGECIQCIGRLAFFDTPNFRRKTEGKFIHANTGFFCDYKMPEFVYENQEEENDNEDKYGHGDIQGVGSSK